MKNVNMWKYITSLICENGYTIMCGCAAFERGVMKNKNVWKYVTRLWVETGVGVFGAKALVNNV